MSKKRQVHYGHHNRIFWFVSIALLVVLLGVAIYFSFIYKVECKNFECYRDKMIECDKARFVNSEPEAHWGYEIKGKRGDNCAVDVKLLLANEGELGIDELEGLEMRCFYPNGAFAYPEKDLNKCRGELKEELQGIVINKLHSYILENLGEIEEGLDGV